MKKTLDFICIGSAKSATTTLFDLIKNHPEIYIPPAKEVGFFNDKKVYDKGLNWYLKTYFKNTDDSQQIGTITPQYMTGGGEDTPRLICERIKQTVPDVKLVVILRHPVVRCYSHYKMRLRTGHVQDSFEKTVRDILANEKNERENLTPANNFFFASEFANILSNYYELFPKKNILVLYTEDLKDSPTETLKKVFNFLKVDSTYTPPNPSQVSHVGGGQPKIKFLAPARLGANPVIRFVWDRMPAPLKRMLFYKVVFWNIKPDNTKLDAESQIYKDLVEYFRADVKKLEKLTGQKAPWPDWD